MTQSIYFNLNTILSCLVGSFTQLMLLNLHFLIFSRNIYKFLIIEKEKYNKSNQILLIQPIKSFLRYQWLKMNYLLELKELYSKCSNQHGIDTKNQQQILSNHQIIQNLTLKDLSKLQIKMSKQTKKYEARKLKRIELEDGTYYYLTDNQIDSQQAIVTLHSAPGNYKEQAGLESHMNGKYRLTNIMLPGFDSQDQRRGSYGGTHKGFSDMSLRIQVKLRLKRIIICGYLFGTTIGFPLVQLFPHIIEGFINIAGLNSIWTRGMGFMYKACIFDTGYYEQSCKQGKPFDKNEFRQQLYKKYADNCKIKITSRPEFLYQLFMNILAFQSQPLSTHICLQDFF